MFKGYTFEQTLIQLKSVPDKKYCVGGKPWSVIKKGSIHLSENQIRKALDAMQVSLTKNNVDNFYLRSTDKENIGAIVNRMGHKKLPNIIAKSENQKLLNPENQ